MQATEPNLKELSSKILNELSASQLDSGEFQTFARTSEGDNFYIGSSPFVSGHIVYFLSSLQIDGVKPIVEKALDYLEGLDPKNRKLFKFWYPENAVQTGYPFLAYDLDDCAVVNTAFHMNQREVMPSFIIDNNKNPEGNYYTWLQASFKTALKKPSMIMVYLEYLKAYNLFTKNDNGLSMALFKDSELIVQMNIDIFKQTIGEELSHDYKKVPITPTEVNTALEKSLHYDNIAMYYLTLAKLQKQAQMLDDGQLEQLITSIRGLINSGSETTQKSQNLIALYLSLMYLNSVNALDNEGLRGLLQNIDSWLNEGFDFCVGNKRYETYHTYWSNDLTKCFALCLLDYLNKTTTI